MQKKIEKQIIGVQLDLGRQKETLDFIFSFVDFIARNGYNTLYLHLESAVRTASFSFARKDKSYSPEEIRSIVTYASEKGITTIPIIATLGHAEHFLAHHQLEHLSEQRGEKAGREFCPSLEETYQFLFQFLKEVSDLFDSDVIHIGCDEVFELASCPLCKKRLEQGETRGQIFLKHLLRIHSFVTGTLGKRTMIWDDMMDFVPEILPLLPKDLECVFWEYDPIVNGKQAKYGNRKRIDIFRKYDTLGLTYHAAPRELGLDNVTSFSQYATEYHPAGLLLTVWEHSCDFMYALYPLIAFTGRFWGKKNADAETVFTEVCRDLFGTPSATLIWAFYAALHPEESLYSLTQSLTSGGYKHYPNDATGNTLSKHILIAEVLQNEGHTVSTELGKRILEDFLIRIRSQIASDRVALWQTNRLFGRAIGQSETLIKEYEKLYADRLRQWEQIRPGMPHQELDDSWNQKKNAVIRTEERASRKKSLLQIIFFLPDFWGRQSVELFARFDSSSEFISVFRGMPKPNDAGEHPYYTYDIPLEQDEHVTEIRIVSFGWNGIGVSFCRVLEENGAVRVPSFIRTLSGIVSDPDNLLKNDTTWTMFGNRDGLRFIFDSEAAAEKHTAILELSEEKI